MLYPIEMVESKACFLNVYILHLVSPGGSASLPFFLYFLPLVLYLLDSVIYNVIFVLAYNLFKPRDVYSQ